VLSGGREKNTGCDFATVPLTGSVWTLGVSVSDLTGLVVCPVCPPTAEPWS
jgi:hypothetical protein